MTTEACRRCGSGKRLDGMSHCLECEIAFSYGQQKELYLIIPGSSPFRYKVLHRILGWSIENGYLWPNKKTVDRIMQEVGNEVS